jgi:hypothetical protein
VTMSVLTFKKDVTLLYCDDDFQYHEQGVQHYVIEVCQLLATGR